MEAMHGKWIFGQEAEFLDLTQRMLDYYALHENDFKRAHSDSVAGCIMLLVASSIGFAKKDFLGALKAQGKTMFGNFKRIKESRSYGPWKKIFKTVIGAGSDVRT